MKKILSYAGWILFGIALVGLIIIVPQSSTNTVDFRGTVVKINNVNERSAYIEAIMVFGTEPRTIRVDSNISIRNLINGERMSVDDIKVGDMIDLNVRGRWDDVTAIIIPRWIRVLPK